MATKRKAEPTHTAIPWTIDPRASKRIVGANGRGVCSCGGPSNNVQKDGGDGENSQNVSLIVDAVNNHRLFLAALKRIAGLQDAMDGYSFESCFLTAEQIARDAIRKSGL